LKAKIQLPSSRWMQACKLGFFFGVRVCADNYCVCERPSGSKGKYMTDNKT
jgi:hypothetical protein